MSTQEPGHPELDILEIALDSAKLPVSSLSSLLRVVQAAVREVARSGDETRGSFAQPSPPMLQLSATVIGEELVLRLAFADPRESSPMPGLSERIFGMFMEQFGQLIKGLPQRGLWGEAFGGAQRGPHESDAARRLGELRKELRRFPRARLRCGTRNIRFEGDRMEIA